MHRRSRLGDRHVVWRDRAAGNGVTMIVDETEFDADRWYRSSCRTEGHGLVHRADRDPHADEDRRRGRARSTICRSLRFLASVGEPLNPEAVVWSKRVYGRPFHDNWWQTETGGIMIANFAAIAGEARDRWASPCQASTPPSSSARPDGPSEGRAEPDVEGELALRPGWPSMFRGYLGEDERYRKCFVDGWYLTGDLAHARRRWLLLVRGPVRRRHQDGRPLDRPIRGRECPDGASRRGRGGCDRQAGRGCRRYRQGVRRAQSWLQAGPNSSAS